MANIFETLYNKTSKQLEENINRVSPIFGGTLAPGNYDPFAKDPVNFDKTYNSYSGADVTVIAQVNNKLIVLGNLATFSYSVFREKVPVRVLGRSHCKGFCASSRVIAGSMIFVVFDRAPLYDIIKELNYVRVPTDRKSSPFPDQLPPIDLILIFGNEYGNKSVMTLYGVEFTQEGQVHSVNDIFSENTMQYVARDMDQLMAYSDIANFKDMLFERQTKGLFIDNNTTALLEYKKRLEQQLSDVNMIIDNIDQEKGKRAVAGVFTLSATYWAEKYLSPALTNKEFVSRDDLNREKDKQLKIKTYIISEIEKTNKQINIYERNLAGWNAQSGIDGTMRYDNLAHAPASPL